jgi:hypothetical protein
MLKTGTVALHSAKNMKFQGFGAWNIMLLLKFFCLRILAMIYFTAEYAKEPKKSVNKVVLPKMWHSTPSKDV